MIKQLLLGGSAPKPAVQTLIGRSTEVHGDVVFVGGLHVDGRIHGNVSSVEGQPAALSLSESGEIHGDVSVANIVVNGSIHGQLTVTDKLTLGAKARINGDVRYRLLRMEPGAAINGQLICEERGPVEALEHVKGASRHHVAT